MVVRPESACQPAPLVYLALHPESACQSEDSLGEAQSFARLVVRPELSALSCGAAFVCGVA